MTHTLHKLSIGALLLSAVACSSSPDVASVFFHPNADLSTYDKVAVLPLENLTTDRFAGDRVREIIVVELSAQGLFEVMEVGEVNRVIRVQNLANIAVLGPAEYSALGEALGVKALVLGSVMEFREKRSGSLTAPDVSLALRMIDVDTGLVVWSASDARTGVGIWTRMFGVGEESQSETARFLVRDLIDTLL